MIGYTVDTKLTAAIAAYENRTGYKPLYAIVPVGYKPDTAEIQVTEKRNTVNIYLDHDNITWVETGK